MKPEKKIYLQIKNIFIKISHYELGGTPLVLT